MSVTQHTPGPWRVWRDQDPKEPFQICGMESDFICEISGINTNREANARLIAAAPELFHMLDTLVNLHDGLADAGEGITDQDWAEARNVIAKSKGQP